MSHIDDREWIQSVKPGLEKRLTERAKKSGVYMENRRVSVAISFVSTKSNIGTPRRGEHFNDVPLTEDDWKQILSVPLSNSEKHMLEKLHSSNNEPSSMENLFGGSWREVGNAFGRMRKNINTKLRSAKVLVRFTHIHGKYPHQILLRKVSVDNE